ncbi:hypothetical protein [Methanosphaerula palustris]|uniref:Uncharacterized protein n=1 Tax=Methanosphaerula palustris (strain ATCC BAA-1556 / DSM 19958 / E1-9c) TaxID=521011 RepID=B8GJB4_METPE|nr:hypothetical protein [Methanosphaerula palustris]ACL16955.1 hypothetical protein Mpal_1643 [Methanosphaerula palustris E1-9c]
MSSYLPSNRIQWGICLAVLTLLLSSALIGSVSATPPPPDYKAWWATTNTEYLNASDAGLFVETDGYISRQGREKRPPFLSNVSDNYYYTNFTSPKTGEQYLTAVWYFSDWDGFIKEKDELHRYLQQHGTVTPVALNLSPELASSNSSDLVNLSGSEQWQAIDATQYESDETSGYLLTFVMDSHPGVNYYIAYYGVVGPTDLREEAHHLHLLAMTNLPVMVLGHLYVFNLTTPKTNSHDSSSHTSSLASNPIFNPKTWIPFLVVFIPILLPIIGFTFIPIIVLAYISARISLWMEARLTPRTRAILPLSVAGCLIGVIALRSLFIEEISLGWTDLIAAAILVPMGVLTVRPFFKERLKYVKPKSAVFLCVVGTFYTIIIGSLLYLLLGVSFTSNPGSLDQPLSYIVGRSVVLRSVILYIMSVVIAIVLYAVILFWDLIRRRRQSKKHKVEDEDQ